MNMIRYALPFAWPHESCDEKRDIESATVNGQRHFRLWEVDRLRVSYRRIIIEYRLSRKRGEGERKERGESRLISLAIFMDPAPQKDCN